MKFFISSTFLDLKEYRQVTINMLSDLIGDRTAATGQIAAMEFFSASEDTPKEVCQAELATSNILIGIYGQRYGSIDPELDLSMTEMEFDYAQENKMPILAFVQQPDGIEARQKIFVENKVGKLQRNHYTKISTIEDFIDKLNETLKRYFQGFDGYSAKSIWSVIEEAKAEIEEAKAEIPSELQMSPYLSGQQEEALSNIISSAKAIKASVPSLGCANNAVYDYVYKRRCYPKQITAEDIDQLKTKVEHAEAEILSNWERINLGLNNYTTQIVLAASYLCLCRMQTRLLTENWTGALRKEVLDVRARYRECETIPNFV